MQDEENAGLVIERPGRSLDSDAYFSCNSGTQVDLRRTVQRGVSLTRGKELRSKRRLRWVTEGRKFAEHVSSQQ